MFRCGTPAVQNDLVPPGFTPQVSHDGPDFRSSPSVGSEGIPHTNFKTIQQHINSQFRSANEFSSPGSGDEGKIINKNVQNKDHQRPFFLSLPVASRARATAKAAENEHLHGGRRPVFAGHGAEATFRRPVFAGHGAEATFLNVDFDNNQQQSSAQILQNSEDFKVHSPSRLSISHTAAPGSHRSKYSYSNSNNSDLLSPSSRSNSPSFNFHFSPIDMKKASSVFKVTTYFFSIF